MFTQSTFRLTGECYSTSECTARTGGFADGSCASGFGTCCIIRNSGCGLELSYNSSHLQNTGYPSALTDSTSCEYKLIKLHSDICFFRLEFVVFSLDVPVSSTDWDCSKDKLEFSTPSSTSPPSICGYNTGQHMYLDASYQLTDTNPSLMFTTSGATFDRYWQIRVDQITCTSDRFELF